MNNANYFIIFLDVIILIKLIDIKKKFGCNLDKDQPVIVTDRGFNMITSFQGYDHIFCTTL